ncbi:MAG TPA: adenylate kinase family protein [Methanocorpusculum sp.]|nr:adenylate kinase family protein [Methanocorpusculum sp.]
MMIGITGTPGTGKTATAMELHARGFPVIDLKTTIAPYVLTHDSVRDADEVDVNAWASEFAYKDMYVEGSLAHFLACDKIVVLRCRPDVLKNRLSSRGYSAAKIVENCQAEALDVILSETVDLFASEQVYEIDTTNRNVVSVADLIVSFSIGESSASFGAIDWSEFLDLML